MAYDWQLSLILEYWPAFLEGFILTMKLTVVSIVAGTLIGYILGILLSLKVAYVKPLKVLINVYIAFFGWLPLLVLMVWMYYFLPVLFNIRFSGLTVSYVALSLNLSAFIADVIRGAIEEIPRTYIDAGKAIGMPFPLILRRIIFPEIVRVSLPSMVALYINQFKWTTLASVLGVSELLHTADTIMIQTYRSLEAYTAIAVIYLVVVGLGNMVYMRMQRMEFFRQRA
ncbi:MAG TPA: amino acid ABC transporter permease [Casimicrobiaceae bacterium]|nr:amino acid ABC transporter permease [Casimicrobiaceae bacterium]